MRWRRMLIVLAAWLPGLAAAPHVRAATGLSTSGADFVYWANTNAETIGRATVDGNPASVNQRFVTSLIEPNFEGEGPPLGVAVDHAHIYFNGGAGITRANLDGTGVQPNFITTGPPPDYGTEVAVDSQHIYWFEAGLGSIERANLDGTGVNSHFITGLGGTNGLSGLAVDGRYIYWLDAAERRIGRADLDGSNVNDAFISVPFDTPGAVNGLAVDPEHIYWGNAYAGTIGRANLDGTSVNDQFITGVKGVHDLADDYRHLFWTDLNGLNRSPVPPDGGTIGRANLDGSNVNDKFLPALQGGVGALACLSEVQVRCAPWGVAVSPPTDPYCLRTATPPPSPALGGAVFARPLDPGTPGSNVVVVPAGGTWSGEASCAGEPGGSAEVMTHPASIEVSPGFAVVLHDGAAKLTSAWGAQSVPPGGAAPVLYPSRSDWTTSDAQVVTQQTLLDTYDSCRQCVLPANLHFTPAPLPPDVAYAGDVSGATLTGASLSGGFARWNFSDADLAGATVGPGSDLSDAKFAKANLQGAVFDHPAAARAVFDRSDLRGAQLLGLESLGRASFAGVQVGPLNGKCTVFEDVDLLNAGFTPAKPGAGCEKSPLLPGSRAPLGLVFLIAHTYHGSLDLAGARYVASAADRARLAGVDLSGIDLSGASFVGFPADFTKTKFDGASVQQTSFELAHLSGASFRNVHGAGASFQDATLSAAGNAGAATFAGSQTDLTGSDFVGANVSGVSFQSADLSGAAFNRALALDTDFNSVVATNTVFSGAHIYGDGQAFDGARDLAGADFAGAVIAGSVDQSGGFDFTGADLTGAKFDGAQCIECTFTGSTLTRVSFSGAYMPGVVLSGVLSMKGVDLTGAWLYCGDFGNGSCSTDPSFSGEWDWPLALGSQESYGPVPFSNTNLTGVFLKDVTACPDGKAGQAQPAGCGSSDLLPPGTLTVPAPCSATALDACPTPTSTVFDASSFGSPLSLVAGTPSGWATIVTTRGYYAGLSDGTVRLVGSGSPQIVAGRQRQHCPRATAPCGDGGAAIQALLGTPAGLAVGLDGSLYIADPALHRVRRIDPPPALSACSGVGNSKRAPQSRAGSKKRLGCATTSRKSKGSKTLTAAPVRQITTVAGDGTDCSTLAARACGDGAPATSAALQGPYGVWVDPTGRLFIADGMRGIREVLPDGTITTIGVGPGSYDVRSVVGGPGGNLYAVTVNPDYLLKLNLASGQVTQVVGTGTSGYNGTTDNFGSLLPGTRVQINHPASLSMTPSGNVLFADTNNDMIRAFVPSTGHVIDDLAGLLDSNSNPQAGFNGDGNAGNQTELDHPQAVAATRGALFAVADTGNKRIRQVGPNPLPGAFRK
ncbi:MAG: pentapeptide repeat-containing protein [Solirubrobacterales bacterium]|nr:pentapeptide repeat-containing protein [Solirubrobacterales bacterium]